MSPNVILGDLYTPLYLFGFHHIGAHRPIARPPARPERGLCLYLLSNELPQDRLPMRFEPVATDGAEADSVEIVHIHIEDRLDRDRASRLRKEGKRYLCQGFSLLVHFEEGSFVDAGGLRALIQLAEQGASSSDQPRVAIMSRSRAADTLLHLCSIPAYLPVRDSEAEARNALRT